MKYSNAAKALIGSACAVALMASTVPATALAQAPTTGQAGVMQALDGEDEDYDDEDDWYEDEDDVDANDLQWADVQTDQYYYAYTGQTVTPALKVSLDEDTVLVAGTDYTVTYCMLDENDVYVDVASPVEIGTYRIEVEGIGEYEGDNYAEFEIVDPHDLSNGYVRFGNWTPAYTGKAVKFKPTVYSVMDEKVPASGYTLTWQRFDGKSKWKDVKGTPKKLGFYHAVVNGTGEWDGELTSEYVSVVPNKPKSVKAKAGKKSAKISWKKGKGANAYYIEATSSKQDKSVMVKGAKKTSYTLKKLKKGTYEVTVTAIYRYGNSEVWGDYAKSVKVKVK